MLSTRNGSNLFKGTGRGRKVAQLRVPQQVQMETDLVTPEVNQIQERGVEIAGEEVAHRIIVREAGAEVEVIVFRINNNNGEYQIRLQIEEEPVGIQ